MGIFKTQLIIWIYLMSFLQGYKISHDSLNKLVPLVKRLNSNGKERINWTILKQESDKQSSHKNDPKQLIDDSQILEGRFMKQLTQYPDWSSAAYNSIPLESDRESETTNIEISHLTDNELENFNPVDFWRENTINDENLSQENVRSLSDEEIDRMNDEDIRSNLLILGEDTEGSTFYLRLRLKAARDRKFPNLCENLNTSQQITSKNSRTINEKVSYYNEMVDSISQNSSNENLELNIIERWKTRIDLSEAYRNPAKFFELNSNLDQKAFETNQIQNLVNESRENLDDHEESQDYLAEQIPKLFEIDEYPISTDRTIYSQDEISIEEKKRKFLGSNNSGIIKDTIEDFSYRFGVSVDFIGDVLCNSGLVGPIPKNKSLKDLVELDVIWDLIELISVSDPIEINDYYVTQSIESLMREFEINEKEIIDLCSSLNIRLPFSTETYLNQDCYDALIGVLKRKYGKNFI